MTILSFYRWNSIHFIILQNFNTVIFFFLLLEMKLLWNNQYCINHEKINMMTMWTTKGLWVIKSLPDMWEQHQCSPGMGKIREQLIGRDVYERKNLLGNRDCSFRSSWPKTEFGMYVYSSMKYNLFYWVVFPNRSPALTWQSVQWRSMGTSQKPWSRQWEAEL